VNPAWLRRRSIPDAELTLDRKVNTDPDSPIAKEPSLLLDTTASGMTLEELLGPDEPDAA
jgi:hypothetical protein